MANNTSNDARRQAPRRKKRRRAGVPVLLTVVLLILALLMGGLGGFVLARRTDTHIHELQAVRDRVTELENTLTLIGYPVSGDVDPEQWLYDATANDSALDDLSGAAWAEDEDDLWQDDDLLSATLPEDIDPVVVAEFDGGTLMSSEVIPAYNDQLTNRIFSGEDAAEVAQDTLNDVMADLVADKLVAAKAEELGLTTLTDEDLSQIDAEAARSFEVLLTDYIAFALNGEGDRESAAQRLAEESGVTAETIAQSLKADWWSRKYFDYVVKDVAVTDEEARARYDELLADQRQAFAENPEAFEGAHLAGDVIVYRPEGYRAVRDVLFALSAEDAAEAARLADQLEQGAADEDAKAQLDALYAPLEAKAQEAEQKLADGTAFSTLMDEYGCSEAIRSEPLRTEGFYVSDHSYVNSTEFVEGSMMLERPGQVTAPLRSGYGVHLVEYVGDVTSGEVPFEEAMEAVRAEALKTKQEAYYAQQRQALLAGANVKYYPERLH